MSASTTKNLSQLFSNLVKKKSKGDNLLDVCFSLPNRGIGRKFCKKGWVEPETFWTVTKTKFGKTTCTNSAIRGQAYGILTWAGQTDSVERPILDIYSKNWTIYPKLEFPTLAAEESSVLETSTETTEESQVEGEQQSQN